MTPEEFKAGIRAVDDFYAAADGLQRPGGMVINGACDIDGVAEWGGRLVQGDSVEFVKTQIRHSDEWQQKHGGPPDPPHPTPPPGPVDPTDPNDPALFVMPAGDVNDPAFRDALITRAAQVSNHREPTWADKSYWEGIWPGLVARGVELGMPDYAWKKLIGWQAGGVDKPKFGPYR